MRNASWVVIAMVIMTGTALAQAPGDTQPPPPPEGAQQPQLPQTGMQVGPVDVDSLLGKVAAQAPAIQTFANGAIRRARRAVAFGPTVGYWGGSVPAQDTYEHALTFGLALEVFKVPILPEPDEIQELIVERAKAKAKEQLLGLMKGQQIDPAEAEKLVKEIYEEVRAEVLGIQNTRNKHMERPNFSLALEADRLWHAEQWMPRFRAGIGIWKFTLAGSFGVAIGGRTKVYTGPEIVVHYLTNTRERSPVIDLFVRADLEVRDRDSNSDQLVFGARFLLDAI